MVNATREPGRRTIGEVLTLLRPEFPDISISKIRYLESQGLISPERTPSGYRKFTHADIERLRFVLSEQRDRYLPLKVIKARVEQWERGELDDEATEGPVSRDEAPAEKPDLGTPLRPVRLDRGGLAEAANVPEAMVDELVAFGLVSPDTSTDEAVYDETDLVIAKIAHKFGTYGIRARHLRIFRQAADRESDLFDRAVAPLAAQAGADAAVRTQKALVELSTLGKHLHQALLVQYLRSRSP